MQIRRRKWKKSEIQVFNREKMLTIVGWNFEIEERCKGVHCVDLGESLPTSIYLQKSASIQPRTSPSKFVGKYSILFTGVLNEVRPGDGNDCRIGEHWEYLGILNSKSNFRNLELELLPNLKCEPSPTRSVHEEKTRQRRRRMKRLRSSRRALAAPLAALPVYLTLYAGVAYYQVRSRIQTY